MLSQKSVRRRFLIQLALSSLVLIGVFSFVLYYVIKSSMYLTASQYLEQKAQLILKPENIDKLRLEKIQIYDPNISHGFLDVSLCDFTGKEPPKQYEFEKDQDNKCFLSFYRPVKELPNTFLVLRQDVSLIESFLQNVRKSIIILDAFSIFAVVFFALFLSKEVLVPIKTLGFKLAKMNEKHLQQVDTNNMYYEFVPLADSLNRLIERVQTFIRYQTDFFIGIAHELKTPLAVMKTKNQVTLLKDRDEEYYKDAIKKNNEAIDEMNKMITSILEIGRQEGAQLDPPIVVDLVTFIKEKANSFKILAKHEDKDIKLDIRPLAYPTLTQPTLILHILQNFVQNAVKFSPKGGVVIVQTRGTDKGFWIEVLDEGCGIDESVDIFAPFKRAGDKSGVGLGLFLSKGAAQALNARISVENRKDTQGTIASLFVPNQRPIK